MTYRILGMYSGETEELDTAEDAGTARELVSEYALAFGCAWTVWCPELGRGAVPRG